MILIKDIEDVFFKLDDCVLPDNNGTNLALINTYINVDEEYNIRLYSTSANNAFCNHGYKINAQFTITCDNSIFTYSQTNDPLHHFQQDQHHHQLL